MPCVVIRNFHPVILMVKFKRLKVDYKVGHVQKSDCALLSNITAPSQSFQFQQFTFARSPTSFHLKVLGDSGSCHFWEADSLMHFQIYIII